MLADPPEEPSPAYDAESSSAQPLPENKQDAPPAYEPPPPAYETEASNAQPLADNKQDEPPAFDEVETSQQIRQKGIEDLEAFAFILQQHATQRAIADQIEIDLDNTFKETSDEISNYLRDNRETTESLISISGEIINKANKCLTDMENRLKADNSDHSNKEYYKIYLQRKELLSAAINEFKKAIELESKKESPAANEQPSSPQPRSEPQTESKVDLGPREFTAAELKTISTNSHLTEGEIKHVQRILSLNVDDSTAETLKESINDETSERALNAYVKDVNRIFRNNSNAPDTTDIKYVVEEYLKMRIADKSGNPYTPSPRVSEPVVASSPPADEKPIPESKTIPQNNFFHSQEPAASSYTPIMATLSQTTPHESMYDHYTYDDETIDRSSQTPRQPANVSSPRLHNISEEDLIQLKNFEKEVETHLATLEKEKDSVFSHKDRNIEKTIVLKQLLTTIQNTKLGETENIHASQKMEEIKNSHPKALEGLLRNKTTSLLQRGYALLEKISNKQSSIELSELSPTNEQAVSTPRLR